MWARVARFEGDPATLDERVEKLKAAADSGAFPDELADARFLLLVNRESGGTVGVTLFPSEEAMREGRRRDECRARRSRKPLGRGVLRGADRAQHVRRGRPQLDPARSSAA